MADREHKGGLGRLFAQAQERRRERKRAKESFHYRETGGGYGGYGGTADRGAYRPDRGQFGAGYTDYGAHGHEAHRPWEGGARPSAGERRGAWEARRLNAEQVGPGAFRRGREDAAYIGEHRGRNWEGGSDAARTAAWFGGAGDDRRAWEGSGPSSERTSDWYGADVGRSRDETWYGGGIHEAVEDRPARDFGSLGGPDMGRFGREPGGDRGGGRGFGGPLGRPGDRARGEQGRLFGGTYQGVDDPQPIAGEAIAGRGHVGGRQFRDLGHFGQGEGDPESHDRFHERHEEGEHFRER